MSKEKIVINHYLLTHTVALKTLHIVDIHELRTCSAFSDLAKFSSGKKKNLKLCTFSFHPGHNLAGKIFSFLKRRWSVLKKKLGPCADLTRPWQKKKLTNVSVFTKLSDLDQTELTVSLRARLHMTKELLEYSMKN